MTWFQGGITEAIATARSNDKMFLVYINGDDDDSKTMMNQCWENEEVKSILSRTCICIKLENGSDPQKQFAEIYPVMIVPVTFVIGKDGIPLEIIGGTISAKELSEKINNVFKNYEKKNSSTSLPGSSQETNKTSSAGFSDDETTFAEPTASSSTSTTQDQGQSSDKEEAAKKLQEKINLKRVQRQKDEEERERQREIERRNVGKNVLKMKEQQQQIKMQKELEERKKEKILEKEALKKVKAQIEQDRLARNSKFKQEKKERDAEREKADAEKEKLLTEQSEEKRKEREKIARIQFRLPSGGTLTRHYPRETTMRDMIADLRSQPTTLPSDFRLSVNMPRRVFGPQDYDGTLAELDLTPNASLFVQPMAAAPVQNKGAFQSVLDLLVAFLFIPVNILSALWKMIAGSPDAGRRDPQPPTRGSPTTSPSPSSGHTASSSQSATSLRQRKLGDQKKVDQDGKMHRLSDIKRDDDDPATWNGNSTQQM